jgi:transcriptional regulator with XRE-family HTH domain
MTNWNQRITEARTDRQMTKADLARACKVSPPTVTDWESGGIKELTADKMLKICDALRVDPWWLVLGKGNFKPSIIEDKTPLSNEARKLISWVERVDGLGGQAPKLFTHINAALQVAGAITQAQNSPVDEAEALAGAKQALTSHIEHSEGKQRHATTKHKQ